MATTLRATRNSMDMLSGPLLSKIIAYAMPLAATSILQQLFNATDIAVVGHCVGHQAQAAVGGNGSLISLIVNLMIGMTVGAQVVMGICIGAGNRPGLRRAVRTSMAVALAGGLLLLVMGQIAAPALLRWIDTPPDVLPLAELYLRIYFLGMPFVAVYNFGATVLRVKGDTRRPLYCLVAGGLLNVALNLLLVIVFGMGVAGVAIATLCGMALASALVLRLLKREQMPYRFRLSQCRISRPELKKMAQVGLPAGLQNTVFSVANVIIQSEINSYGSAAMAGSANALNYEYIAYFIITAFNSAATTFISQNYGAGQRLRCRKVFYLAMLMAVLFSGVLDLLFVWQEYRCIAIFSTNCSVMEYAFARMNIVLLWQWLACSYEVSSSCLRGVGVSTLPTIITVFGTCVVRLIWVWCVCPHYPGFDVLMSCYPFSWCITGTAVMAAAFWVFRHKGIPLWGPMPVQDTRAAQTNV